VNPIRRSSRTIWRLISQISTEAAIQASTSCWSLWYALICLRTTGSSGCRTKRVVLLPFLLQLSW